MIVDAHNPFAHRLHSLTHLIIDESQQIACWHISLVIPQCLQQRFNRTGQISRRCPVIPNIVIIIGCILRFFKHRQRKITFRTISIFPHLCTTMGAQHRSHCCCHLIFSLPAQILHYPICCLYFSSPVSSVIQYH